MMGITVYRSKDVRVVENFSFGFGCMYRIETNCNGRWMYSDCNMNKENAIAMALDCERELCATRRA